MNKNTHVKHPNYVLVEKGRAIDFKSMTKEQATQLNEQFKQQNVDKEYQPCKMVKSIKQYVDDM